MSSAIQQLTSVLSSGIASGAEDRTRESIRRLFSERYQERSFNEAALRIALMPGEGNVPFAGFIHPENPRSGVYGGMSLIWFPIAASDEGSAGSLLTFVCGTRGLAPDEQIIGRPGHARYLSAMARYLREQTGISVWIKRDPTNLAEPFPQSIAREHPRFGSVFNRYGQYLYAVAELPDDLDRASVVVQAFLDFYAWERRWPERAAVRDEIDNFRRALRAHLFPGVTKPDVTNLLLERRFVVLQGPPGTGKSRLAELVLREDFKGRGTVVQFHPAVTYETFIGGISPDVQRETLLFRTRSGWLTEAAESAESGPYLLVIDEINRADLGKVLGEALYLFEAREINEGRGRSVRLPVPLNGRSELSIPPNLYVLGTMNSADRSIAILDLAVRRRFAFVDIWPDAAVVEQQGVPLATRAFGRLLDIFADYAPPDALVLLPGHAYFLGKNDEQVKRQMRFELLPLLREYMQEGRLGSLTSELHAYCDWLEHLL